MNRDLIAKGLQQFNEQAHLVSETYGGSVFRWYLSMAWCLVRYGARPKDYVRFEFHKKSARERNRYLTVYRFHRLSKKFGSYNVLVRGKIAEYKTFANYIHRPWMVADKKTDPQSLRDFIAKQNVVFAKPNGGALGQGVLKIKSEDSKEIEELLAEIKKGAYVVEGVIEQDPATATINPSSVNTVRAYTLIKKNGETEILGIMLRVGRKGSHVDNWGSGGIGYDFDLDTGICVGYGRDKKNKPYVFHPDSNVQMIGYRLPDYDKLRATIIEMSQLVPAARFVGWDIAITPSGYELVEMNCPGGHDFLQAFGKSYWDLLKKELN